MPRILHELIFKIVEAAELGWLAGELLEQCDESAIDQLRSIPKLTDALEDDRTLVLDCVEGLRPGSPINRTLPGYEMRVVFSVVIVDMRGLKVLFRGACLSGKVRGDLGMARVKRQGDRRVVKLHHESVQVEHSTSWVDARGHVFHADCRASPLNVLSQFPKTVFKRGSAVVELEGGRESPRVHDEMGAPSFPQPVRAPLEILNGFRLSTLVGARQVDVRGSDRLASPTTMGAMDGQTGVTCPVFDLKRVGKPLP